VAICDGVLYGIGFAIIGLPYAIVIGAVAMVERLSPGLNVLLLGLGSVAEKLSTLKTHHDDLRRTVLLEHLGVLEIEIERGALKARVESNNTSAPVFCPIGTEVRIDLNWLHRLTITRRQTQVSGP